MNLNIAKQIFSMANKMGLWLVLLVAAILLSAASSAQAAVTGTSTAMTSNPMNTLKAGIQKPVLMLNLNTTSSPPENLGSVTITIATTTNATSTALSTSSFSFVGVAKDTNSNGLFDGGDAMLATTTVSGIAATTTINVGAATTTPAAGNFFIVVGAAGTSTFTDNGYPETAGAVPQKFVVQISTSTGVVASSTNASLTGATTTAPFTADIHSQAPDATKLSANYNGSAYSIFDTSNAGGVGEMGTLNVYSSSTSTVPFATSSLSSIGQTNASLGATYYPSVWLDVSDIAGNATSSKVQYNLSTYKPTVTSFNAFTDRIIVNTSWGLRGDQASNCGNYLINGSAPSCSNSPGLPYIDFRGSQIVIKNLSLSGTVSFNVNGLIQDTNPDGFPLSYSTSSAPVLTALVPTISSVSPASGLAGTSITITGSNFGAATGTVYFSGGFSSSTGPLPPVQASTTAWSGISITATVPAGAQSGPVQVISSAGMMSDITQNTFFDVLQNVYIKLALATSTSPITTSTNMRIFIGGPSGEHIYYVGDASSTSFGTSTYVYTIPNVSSQGFVWAYDASGAKLPAPGMNLQSGTSSSSPQTLVLTGSTSYNVSGTVTLGSSCVANYRNQNVAVMAIPQGQSVQMGPGGIQPAFFTTNNSCQAAYALALSATSTYDVEAHLPPSTSAAGLLDPAGQTAVIATSTPTATANFTFTTASHSIYGQVVGGDSNPLSADKYNNLWVFAYQPVAGGQGAAARPDSSGYFRLYATTGAYKLSVGGPQMPMNIEQDILVTTSTSFDSNASTPVVIIKLAPPTSYIDGYVKDGSSNAVSGADVFSYCSNSPGGGHGTTDSQGYYKMYVPPCSNYHVNGFSSTYGQFTEQSGINIAASGSSASVNFTINSSNFVTVSGTVSQNSSAVSGANVWITQGSFGPGVAGGQTDTSGAFSLKVKSGLSNLYVHAAAGGRGELANQQLASGGMVSSDQAGINLSANVATLTIRLSPGNTFSQAFLGAHSSMGGGFANTAIATSSSYDTYQIQVPYSGGGTSYTIDGGIPNFGPVPATSTTVTGNATISINLSSISFYAVSGSVSGDYSSAFVWAGGSSGGGGTQVVADGTFSMLLRAGTYDIGVSKPGYIGSLLPSQTISTTTTGLSLSLAQSTSTISGTVYYSGSAVSGVRVWADSSAGGWAGGQTDANGAFSLSVSPGAWRIHAVADGYQLSSPLLVTAPASGLSVNLSAVSFTSVQQLQSISPSQGGVVQASSTKVQIPQGALGSGSTNVQVSIQDTMSTPQKKGATVIGNGENISASYASGSNQGQSVSTLSSNVTISFVLTKTQLVAGGITSLSQAQNMQIGYDDTTSNSWTYIPTTVTASSSDSTWNNLESITLSGTTSHFSTYAPVSPTSGSAPSTPTGVSASAGNGQITLSWNVVSGATKYDVYRQSGSNYVYLAQTTNTSYTDTGLTNGTSYSYKVSALDDSNNESAASTAVSATPSAPASGGGGGGGGAAPAPYFTINNGASSASSPDVELEMFVTSDVRTMSFATSSANLSSSTSVPYASIYKWNLCGMTLCAPGSYTVYARFFTSTAGSTYDAVRSITLTNISAAATTTVVTPPSSVSAATPVLPAQAVSAIFSTALRLGAQGKDVTRLQELLAQYPDVYPEGKVTGYFGPLTEEAVQRFQKKYGIVSSGSPAATGYGILGPKTRAKLAEVFGGGAAARPQVQPAAPSATIQELKAKIQELQQQVLQLLQQLMQLLKAKAGA